MTDYNIVWILGTDLIRDFWLESGPDADLRGTMAELKIINPVSGAVLLEASTDVTRTPDARITTDFGVVSLHIEDAASIDTSALPRQYVYEPIPSPDAPTGGYLPSAQYEITLWRIDGLVSSLVRGMIGFSPQIATL